MRRKWSYILAGLTLSLLCFSLVTGVTNQVSKLGLGPKRTYYRRCIRVGK